MQGKEKENTGKDTIILTKVVVELYGKHACVLGCMIQCWDDGVVPNAAAYSSLDRCMLVPPDIVDR